MALCLKVLCSTAWLSRISQERAFASPLSKSWVTCLYACNPKGTHQKLCLEEHPANQQPIMSKPCRSPNPEWPVYMHATQRGPIRSYALNNIQQISSRSCQSPAPLQILSVLSICMRPKGEGPMRSYTLKNIQQISSRSCQSQCWSWLSGEGLVQARLLALAQSQRKCWQEKKMTVLRKWQ